MKKIIEISSLSIIMISVIIIDISMCNKIKQIKQKKYNEAEERYQIAQADKNQMTLITEDDFLINKAEKFLEEKREREYQEYLEYLKTLVVYDGLTMDQLAEKLDRSLKNELHGYGRLYAEYSLEKGVDPYIAVAISLHETGCNGTCSTLMKECNNVGGQKGSPTCGNYGYRGFATLEDGIKGYIDNLSNNYFGMGLNTPELMAKKYAASTTWAEKVNYYINTIKSR